MANGAQRDTSICKDVLELVGNTPCVRMNRVGSDLECELVAKLEFFNPGGSVKDRIAKRMVDEALKDGTIKEGYTVVEPTSGNTGIGLSLAATVRGLKAIICMPMKMSQEKISVLQSLGADVRRTPTEAAFDHPDSHISLTNNIVRDNANHVCLDQYINVNNPKAHEEGTAREILRQCDGKVDMVVVGTGTGGTISGVARELKKSLPNVIIVGVDPDGSILHDPVNAKADKPYEVEGIGYDFIPKVCDLELVDRWEVIGDKEAFNCARRLIKEEGLLVGGSSGSILAGALRAAKTLKKGQRCVFLCPDGIRNYLTKYANDDWMTSRGLLEGPPNKKPTVSGGGSEPAAAKSESKSEHGVCGTKGSCPFSCPVFTFALGAAVGVGAYIALKK